MDASYENFAHHAGESPLPEVGNHWAPLFLPLVARVLGLLPFGIMLLTPH